VKRSGNEILLFWTREAAPGAAAHHPKQAPVQAEIFPQIASVIALGLRAAEYLDAEAMRSKAAHVMARVHMCFDLEPGPSVPACPPLADAAVADPVEALWTRWAPWTATFNITRQPAIGMAVGLRATGLPNAVQAAAAQYREDLVLRAARVIELAKPRPLHRSP
jgi:Asp-tRNA(Asn)/Glu-tRNA(Gln) amidotransferase A subunit family amidase